MAPITRNQEKNQSLASETEGKSTEKFGENKSNGHIRFGSNNNNDIANGGNFHQIIPDPTKQPSRSPPPPPLLPQFNNNLIKEKEQEQVGDSEDDDDAPEAVTMVSGRQTVEKQQKSAQKAIKAQQEVARKKRKRREEVLKEQKEVADRRKLLNLFGSANHDELPSEPASAKQEVITTSEDNLPPPNTQPKIVSKKLPTLLPDSLLKDISLRPSPSPPRSHKRTRDFDSEEDNDDESNINIEISKAALKKREKNRKERAARKAKLEFRKGPVTVKVLKDDRKSQQILVPSAFKTVVATKSSWLNGRGAVKRKAIGSGGFLKNSFKK